MKKLSVLLFLSAILINCSNPNKSSSINKMDSVSNNSTDELSLLEDKQLNLKIRYDTIMQNIQLGMYKPKVEQIMNSSISFFKYKDGYCYQFTNLQTLNYINWHLVPDFMYHNDSLANFKLIAYKFELKDKGIILSEAFKTICENYQIKYGIPKFIKTQEIGPYYWINGNREILIELKKDEYDVMNWISIEYKDLTRQVLGKISPLKTDGFNNTYTQSYWDNVKSKEFKNKLNKDL